MSALETLRISCAKRAYKSFKDLDNGEYIIRSFCRTDSTHGPRIRIDLDDSYMLLPARISSKLDDNAIKELNETPKIMHYQGKDKTDKDR